MSLSSVASRVGKKEDGVAPREKRRWRRCGCDWLDRGGTGTGLTWGAEAAGDLRGRYPRRWFRCPTWARPERGSRVPRLARARAPPPPARAPRWAPRLGGAVLAGAAFLGAGMPLPAPAPAALPPVVTMDGEGKRAHRSASRSTSRERWRGAGAGTGDRIGRKKRILFFLRGAARCRAGTRGVGRGASSDLSHAPRRSSRLPSLGLSLSRRPAGLAPWGAGLGAWGRGDGTGKVSRVVSGWRPRESQRRPSGDDRTRAARSPPLGNARATVDAGALTSFFFAPFLVTSSNFSTAGLGWAGRGSVSGCASGARRRGHRGGPRHLVFRRARNKSRRSKARRRSGLAMFRACDSLSIRAFVAASMSPPYFLSMATTSSSPWPVIGDSSVCISCFAICVFSLCDLSTPFASRLFHGSLTPVRVYPRTSALRSKCARRMPARAQTRTAAG